MSQDLTVRTLEAGPLVQSFSHVSCHLSTWQVHDSAATFAAAYCLGKQESGAAINLLKFVPQRVKEGLTLLVQHLS